MSAGSSSTAKSCTLTTGAIYRAFDGVIQRVEERLAAARTDLSGYDPDSVRKRLSQRIVELTVEGFTRQAVLGSGSLPTGVFAGGGLSVDASSGSVWVTRRLWATAFVHFVVLWVRLLGALVQSLTAPRRGPARPATLVFQPGGIDADSDERFVLFCREGPIEPLRGAEDLLVETPVAPVRRIDPSVRYTRRAIVELVRDLPRRVAVRLLFLHFLTPLRFGAAVAQCPLCILLARDLALAPAVSWLDKHGFIQAMVTSTSAFTSQPLWMKGMMGQRFKLHMVWYSQNFIPKMYVEDEKTSDLPSARHMRVDVHWVWTPGFREYLRGRGQVNDILVVGPILWYLPRRYDPPTRASIKVAVFDVTPFIPAKEAFGAAKNYYSVETIAQFVRDTVDVCEDLALELGRSMAILLKHKRGTCQTAHDARYLAFLDEIARRRSGFSLIDHRVNVFGLLESCDISISVPYTSTAYVAASLAKPAVYYDPFGELVPVFEPSKFVYFAAGPDALRELMKQLLAGSDTSRADARGSAAVM